jgi:sugar-specific transcriptional regulator TrmB
MYHIMEITNLLKDFGLTDSEIQIYLFLLAHGQASPPAIAKGTKIARPHCYSLLQSLKQKMLIVDKTKGKRKMYFANDPTVLVQELEQRRIAMEKALPELRSQYAKLTQQPMIRFFEGMAQAKHLYEMLLDSRNKEVLGLSSTKLVFERLGRKYFGNLEKSMFERGIRIKDILTKESYVEAGMLTKSNLRQLYTFKQLPEKAGDLPIDIMIWDDHVALISLEQPIFATLITNQAIADAMRIMHDQSWQGLR